MPSITQLIATAEITIAGTPIPRFDSVYLNQPFESHHTFEIILSPGMLPEQISAAVPLNELANQFVGEPIVIRFIQGESILGVIREKQKQLFRGIVTAVRISKTQAGTTTVIISGSSPTILLCAGPATRSFQKVTIGDIARQLTSEVNLTSNISPKQDWMYDYTVQYEEDAFTYLQRNAGLWGEWMYYDGETFFFGPKPSVPPVDLSLGVNLYDLDYSLRVTPLNGKWVMQNYLKNEPYDAQLMMSWNELQSYAQEAAGKASSLFKGTPAQHLAALHTTKRLDDMAKQDSAKRTTELALLVGRTPDMTLRVGGKIKVKEGIFAAVDARIGAVIKDTTDFGQFVVTRLTHYIDGRGVYQATFEAVPLDGDNAPVKYTVPPYQLASDTAEVKAVNDPLKLGRVQVQFPWQRETNATTDWIMTAHPMGGKERGVYFVPEINDIVWITYPSGLPDFPFVQSAMYNNTDPPGSELFHDENNLKGIITRGGNHIIIDDESGKQSIKIFNHSEQNSIELSLDGPHITITSNGSINLQAGGDLILDAGGDIKIKGGKNLDVSIKNMIQLKTDSGQIAFVSADALKLFADADIIASAGNVSVSANQKASIEANANLELKSSGPAVLKGATVAIN